MSRRTGARPWLVRGGLLGVTLAFALPFGTAYADTSGASIDHVQTGDGVVKLLVSVPGTDQVDLGSVTASIGARSAEAKAEDASTTDEVSRTTVLAIDASNSMRGNRIREAKSAALAYLDAVPANVSVGVVTFADAVDEVLSPTLDRDAARSAVQQISLSLKTSLYAGVTKAVAAAGGSGQREVLVLSDGKDTTGAPVDGVLRQIRRAGVKVDVVSLEQADQANPALNQMADAGKGTVLSAADPTALTAAYSDEAQVLARQVLVTVSVPAGQSRDDANVEVGLTAGGQTYTDSAFVTVRKAAAAAAPTAQAPQRVEESRFSVPRGVVLAAVLGIGAALVAIVVALFAGGRDETAPVSLEEQIGSYGVTGKRVRRRDGAGDAGVSLADQAKDVAARALANNRSLEARIEHRLDAAGMALKPAEWVLIHAGITIAAGLVGGLVSAGNPVLIILLLAAGAIVPWLYLGVKRSRRLRAFDSHLADTLQLMSGSLSAGLSLAQSLDTIVREGTDPVSSEFRRVIVESRLGVDLEDALDGVADRMDSKDFAWVVMAIRIQRQVGGNLAELLLTVAATLREREFLRRHVQALSAEGRLSCWILGALPPVFLGYLVLTKPDYVHPMFTSPLGLLMCVAMGVLLAVGIFWMSKVAKVEL